MNEQLRGWYARPIEGDHDIEAMHEPVEVELAFCNVGRPTVERALGITRRRRLRPVWPVICAWIALPLCGAAFVAASSLGSLPGMWLSGVGAGLAASRALHALGIDPIKGGGWRA